MQLSDRDRGFLSGEHGEAGQLAMELLVRIGESQGAARMIDITWAHVAGAFDNGQANHDFAERLAAGGARVAVPTTLTACSIDTQHRVHGDDDAHALALIDLYMGMGCEAVLTCAPYHTHSEPCIGQHLAWCESSAVVYANSVLGARTNRYVEFLDICAAITGRAPEYGLHTDDGRFATALVKLEEMPPGWLDEDWFYQLLGTRLGELADTDIPAIVGLPASVSHEQLRALGAAAATSGSVSMFHAVGVTPEARTLDHASGGRGPRREIHIAPDDISFAGSQLSRNAGEPLAAICLGAPHFSLEEFRDLDRLLSGRKVDGAIRCIVSTSQDVLAGLQRTGLLEGMYDSGVEIVTGRCTYYRPAVEGCDGHAMTNSAKWAGYAPTALGVPVTFSSLERCVEAACAGEIPPGNDPWVTR